MINIDLTVSGQIIKKHKSFKLLIINREVYYILLFKKVEFYCSVYIIAGKHYILIMSIS